MSKSSSQSRPAAAQKKSAATGSKQPKATGKVVTSTGPAVRKADTQTARSKSAQILQLLQRRNGASLEELTKATGWQAHSLRGFLSGTVKKRLALNLQTIRSEAGERRYILSGGE